MRSALAVAAIAVTSSSTLFSISSTGLRTWSPTQFCSFAFLRNRGRSNLAVIAISFVVYEVGTAPGIDNRVGCMFIYMLRKLILPALWNPVAPATLVVLLLLLVACQL
jgi:hypothetical protein